ncbi:MAG: RICIN domain-containing protein, partial [Oscillospiraceae bacterium]|nr:RICIN domain-containing protein [Oscillospiraceae bacterium]
SELADGKTYYLDVDYGKTDNGTNIGIWSNTNCDAQSFKFVDNGDGTYAICTKVTGDESALGVAAASKDIGANVVEWSFNDSADQKWIIEPVFEPVMGRLIKSIDVMDTAYYSSWGIDTSLEAGDKAFGDRDVEKIAFSEVPDKYKGAELVLTPCDAKFSDKQQAELTAAEDITVYIGFDIRMTAVPSWVNGWTKETDTIKTSNDVTFEMYSKEIKADETITLGANGQSGGVVNYIVLAAEKSSSLTSVPGDLTCDEHIDVFDLAKYRQFILGTRTLEGTALANADINGDGAQNVSDMVLLQSFLIGKIKSFE